VGRALSERSLASNQARGVEDKITPEQSFSNANVLKAHFINAGE
jgi:hypothetical protein